VRSRGAPATLPQTPIAKQRSTPLSRVKCFLRWVAKPRLVLVCRREEVLTETTSVRISRTGLSCLLPVKVSWNLSCQLDFHLRPTHPIAFEQPEFGIQPLPTPSLPAEALPLSGTHQMPPTLLLYPVLTNDKHRLE
jgi:hypothetical protein